MTNESGPVLFELLDAMDGAAADEDSDDWAIGHPDRGAGDDAVARPRRMPVRMTP